SVLKPQPGHRHTACMRYISSPQRSQSTLSAEGPAETWPVADDVTGVMDRGWLRAAGAPSGRADVLSEALEAEAGGVGSDTSGIIACVLVQRLRGRGSAVSSHLGQGYAEAEQY